MAYVGSQQQYCVQLKTDKLVVTCDLDLYLKINGFPGLLMDISMSHF